MSIGIYVLYLGEPGKYYIGQGNIRERVQQHRYMLKHNRHYNYKLQQAYNLYKVFSYNILVEGLAQKYLYVMEDWYIEVFNSIGAGYNICSAGIAGRGTEHPSSVYSKEQIVACMIHLLDINNTVEYISNITGVSTSTVRHISRREVHHWLEEEYPEEAALLKRYSDTRLRSTRPTKARKYSGLISPKGEIYPYIENICAFSREHDLNNAHIGAVLRGTRNTHMGWSGYNISQIEV